MAASPVMARFRTMNQAGPPSCLLLSCPAQDAVFSLYNRNTNTNTNIKKAAQAVCNVSHGSRATQIDCTADKFNLSTM